MTTFEGTLSARDQRLAIIAARFNDFITGHLVDGALDCIRRHDGAEPTLYRCPGAYEIPMVAQQVARTGKFDGIICLGAVIRGSTPHFDYVAGEVAKGIAHVSLAESLPIAFGVLTTDTIEQAIERAGTKAGNNGWEAAMTAIEMVSLFGRLRADG